MENWDKANLLDPIHYQQIPYNKGLILCPYSLRNNDNAIKKTAVLSYRICLMIEIRHRYAELI